MSGEQVPTERIDAQRSAVEFCFQHPDVLLAYHTGGTPFLAILPEQGVAFSAQDEEEFEAKLNDLRPSIRSQLFLTHTSLWILGLSIGGQDD